MPTEYSNFTNPDRQPTEREVAAEGGGGYWDPVSRRWIRPEDATPEQKQAYLNPQGSNGDRRVYDAAAEAKRYQGMAAPAHAAAPQIDQTDANAARGLQDGGIDMLRERAEGGPSAAQYLMGQQTRGAVAGVQSSAASIRGGAMARAAASRGATTLGSRLTAQGLQDRMALKARESHDATGQLLGVANERRGQDLGVATDQAKLQAGQNAANDQRDAFYENLRFGTKRAAVDTSLQRSNQAATAAQNERQANLAEQAATQRNIADVGRIGSSTVAGGAQAYNQATQGQEKPKPDPYGSTSDRRAKTNVRNLTTSGVEAKTDVRSIPEWLHEHMRSEGAGDVDDVDTTDLGEVDDPAFLAPKMRGPSARDEGELDEPARDEGEVDRQPVGFERPVPEWAIDALAKGEAQNTLLNESSVQRAIHRDSPLEEDRNDRYVRETEGPAMHARNLSTSGIQSKRGISPLYDDEPILGRGGKEYDGKYLPSPFPDRSKPDVISGGRGERPKGLKLDEEIARRVEKDDALPYERRAGGSLFGARMGETAEHGYAAERKGQPGYMFGGAPRAGYGKLTGDDDGGRAPGTADFENVKGTKPDRFSREIMLSDDRAKLKAAWDQGHAAAVANVEKVSRWTPEDIKKHSEGDAYIPEAATVRGIKTSAWDEGNAAREPRPREMQFTREETAPKVQAEAPKAPAAQAQRSQMPRPAVKRDAVGPGARRAAEGLMRASRPPAMPSILDPSQMPSDKRTKMDMREADPMADANRAMKPSVYEYKPGFAEEAGQSPGEKNVGPMAQNMAADPIAKTAIMKRPDGMLAIDKDKALKLTMGSLSSLQRQIDQIKKARGA